MFFYILLYHFERCGQPGRPHFQFIILLFGVELSAYGLGDGHAGLDVYSASGVNLHGHAVVGGYVDPYQEQVTVTGLSDGAVDGFCEFLFV